MTGNLFKQTLTCNLFVLSDHYEKYIKKLQEDFQSEQTTGLMLIYRKYIVHVIEVCIVLFAEC